MYSSTGCTCAICTCAVCTTNTEYCTYYFLRVKRLAPRLNEGKSGKGNISNMLGLALTSA